MDQGMPVRLEQTDAGLSEHSDRRFGILGPDVFLNHASVSPPCRAARLAVQDAAQRIAADDDEVVSSAAVVRRARREFACFVSGRPEAVQAFQNTSTAISAVAFGFPWRHGDQVLVSGTEFVSNLMPWRMQASKGVRVRYLHPEAELLDPEYLAIHMNDRVRVVAVSAVHWLTGARSDLRALAELVHDFDAFLVVDAAQSLGAVRHSRANDDYDLLATNTYKWLLSYNGAAFAAFSLRLEEVLEPSSFGWLSVIGGPEPHSYTNGEANFNLEEGVGRFVGGAPSTLSNIAAIAALQDLQAYGLDAIESQVERNAQMIIAGATDWGFVWPLPPETVNTPVSSLCRLPTLEVQWNACVTSV